LGYAWKSVTAGWGEAAYCRSYSNPEVPIPLLHIKGVSTGDFDEALVALLVKQANFDIDRRADP
jgi:hypothetical protein